MHEDMFSCFLHTKIICICMFMYVCVYVCMHAWPLVSPKEIGSPPFHSESLSLRCANAIKIKQGRRWQPKTKLGEFSKGTFSASPSYETWAYVHHIELCEWGFHCAPRAIWNHFQKKSSCTLSGHLRLNSRILQVLGKCIQTNLCIKGVLRRKFQLL